jgi:hypothetical protein
MSGSDFREGQVSCPFAEIISAYQLPCRLAATRNSRNRDNTSTFTGKTGALECSCALE